MLRAARRAHEHFTNFPVRWVGGLVAFAAVLTTLLKLPRLGNGLRDSSLRAHPERAPRESAALWDDRMVGRMARVGWRKSPSQNPLGFRAALQESALQNKIPRF